MEGVDNLVGDRTAFGRLLASPHVALHDFQYVSGRHASATLKGCADEQSDECRSAILVTQDNWRSEEFLVLPGGMTDTYDLWTRLLPTGDVAVVVADYDTEKLPFPPFVLGPDGSTRPLNVSAEPADPGPDSVFVSEPSPPVPPYGVWALDAASSALYPIRSQPSACRRDGILESLVKGPTGVLHAAFVCGGEAGRVDNWARLARSKDNSVSWDPGDLPDELGPWPGDGLALAAGPGDVMAISWASDPGSDYVPMRLFVTEEQQPWRRIATGAMPESYLPNIAYRSDGRLLIAPGGETTGRELWELPLGANTPTPVREAPRLRHLKTAGDTVVVQTGDRTLAVSKDLAQWVTVQPGASAEVRR